MKKRTLNQTWVLCLRKWRWIVKMVREGTELSVPDLKDQWLRENGFFLGEEIVSCFFCTYNGNSGGMGPCENCPGVLVDYSFDCCAPGYNYCEEPIAFYKELLRLNRIRKGK